MGRFVVDHSPVAVLLVRRSSGSDRPSLAAGGAGRYPIVMIKPMANRKRPLASGPNNRRSLESSEHGSSSRGLGDLERRWPKGVSRGSREGSREGEHERGIGDGVGGTYLNGRGGRIRADTPSPSLLIPVANIPSYVGRVWKTA